MLTAVVVGADEAADEAAVTEALAAALPVCEGVAQAEARVEATRPFVEGLLSSRARVVTASGGTPSSLRRARRTEGLTVTADRATDADSTGKGFTKLPSAAKVRNAHELERAGARKVVIFRVFRA